MKFSSCVHEQGDAFRFYGQLSHRVLSQRSGALIGKQTPHFPRSIHQVTFTTTRLSQFPCIYTYLLSGYRSSTTWPIFSSRNSDARTSPEQSNSKVFPPQKWHITFYHLPRNRRRGQRRHGTRIRHGKEGERYLLPSLFFIVIIARQFGLIDRRVQGEGTIFRSVTCFDQFKLRTVPRLPLHQRHLFAPARRFGNLFSGRILLILAFDFTVNWNFRGCFVKL